MYFDQKTMLKGISSDPEMVQIVKTLLAPIELTSSDINSVVLKYLKEEANLCPTLTFQKCDFDVV